jgi:hypothetical protein
MAYLNVRERRIETKIAYVGPALAGKATNLQQLQSNVSRGRATDILETPVDGGALVFLEWMPLQMPRFNDCDIAVKVVAARGTLSSERLDDLLEDVDGVVVVVDAAVAAQDESRRAIALVREALAKGAAVQRPVVVQLNKSDLEGALHAADAVTTLDTADWPVVTAAAARGDGVIETLEAALNRVLEAMSANGIESPPDVRADHNPLLTALRQILRDTVTEHMAALERETVPRLVTAVTSSVGAPDVALLSRLERLERGIDELRQTLAAMRAEAVSTATEAVNARSVHLHATNELVATVGRMTIEAGHAAAMTYEMAERIADVHTNSLELSNRGDLAAVEARLREELTTRGRADREHVTSALAVIRRAMDALTVDLKKGDVREQLAAMHKDVEQVRLQAKELSATAASTAGVPARLGGLETRLGVIETMLQRELNGNLGSRLTRIDESVQLMHVDAGESFARADARIGELQSGLSELLDDFKKRKKGWFA